MSGTLVIHCMADSILLDLDWDDGLAIPVANAENKKLEEEVLVENIL